MLLHLIQDVFTGTVRVQKDASSYAGTERRKIIFNSYILELNIIYGKLHIIFISVRSIRETPFPKHCSCSSLNG